VHQNNSNNPHGYTNALGNDNGLGIGNSVAQLNGGGFGNLRAGGGFGGGFAATSAKNLPAGNFAIPDQDIAVSEDVMAETTGIRLPE